MCRSLEFGTTSWLQRFVEDTTGPGNGTEQCRTHHLLVLGIYVDYVDPSGSTMLPRTGVLYHPSSSTVTAFQRPRKLAANPPPQRPRFLRSASGRWRSGRDRHDWDCPHASGSEHHSPEKRQDGWRSSLLGSRNYYIVEKGR